MKLLSAFATASLATAALYAREDVVTTIVTTLAEESTTYVVVDGQTEETVVSGTPSVVEVAAAETTVELSEFDTHTQVQATTITIAYGAVSDGAGGAATITMSVNGKAEGGEGNGEIKITPGTPYTTAWTYPGTILSLSFSSRQTAFVFTGEATTEVVIPPEHTHVTVDGVETAVDLPGLTTTLTVSSASNVIVDLPEVTTTLEFTAETYTLTVNAYTAEANTCNGVSLDGAAAGSACVLALTTTVVLPNATPSILYLHATGLTTAFTLPGITTTFVPEQTITIVKDGSTETSVIPAVVSTYTTTMSDTNVSSEGSSMEPTITGPVTITVTEPGTTEPGTTEPGTTNNSTTIPGTTEPGTTEPGTEYTTTEPGTTGPVTIPVTEPGTTEPGTTEPGTTNDSTTIPGTTIPGTTEPGTEYTTTEPGSDFTVSQSVYTSDGSVHTTDVEVPITTPSGTASQPQTSANVPTAPAGSLNTACSVVLGPMSGEDVALLEVIFSGTIDGTTYAQWLVNYASQLTRQIDNVAAQALADSGRQYTTAFNTIDVTGILGLASAAPMYTCYLSSLWAEALRNPQQYAKRAAPTQDEKTKLIVLFERRDDNSGSYDLAELLVDETDDLIAEMNSVIGGQIANPSNYANLFTRLNVRQLLSLASEAPVYTSGLSAAMQTALASYMATATDRVTTIVTDIVSGSSTYRTTIVSTLGQAAPVQTTAVVNGPAASAPVNRVTTEVITLDNGRVETRTVTVCVENCDTVVAQSTRRPAAVQTVTTRPNVAVYTQVQNGVTYTHTIEIQTKNAALKKVAALGAGILGGAALLL